MDIRAYLWILSYIDLSIIHKEYEESFFHINCIVKSYYLK